MPIPNKNTVNQLNLNLLRSLHALLACTNVTRAADRLNLTQSAMSRNLALLREHLGDPSHRWLRERIIPLMNDSTYSPEPIKLRIPEE